MPERRKYRRFRINIKGALIADGTSEWVKIVDISIDGLRIMARKSVKPGDRISIHLQAVKEYTFHGTVRWAMYTLENDKTPYEIGIESDKIVQGRGTAASPAEKAAMVFDILTAAQHPEARLCMADLP